MKIFNTDDIREADKITVLKQGITYTELMERAGTEAFLWLKNRYPDKGDPYFHIFCGQGNNGGDGLVIGRLLHDSGYKIGVEVVEDAGKPSESFLHNKERLENAGVPYAVLNGLGVGGLVIIDAIFGIGLTREPQGKVKDIIEKINSKGAFIVSIDVPSGVFMDKKAGIAIKSDMVLTFQQPKLAFYLPDNYPYIKKIEILDIGLDREFIATVDTHHYLTDDLAAHKRYKPVKAFSHKGTLGHALIIGGSYGKIGAACLSAKAALKSGCGLVTAYIPKCGYTALQTAFPEAMVLTDGDEHITQISFDFEPKAIGIGVGMGQHPDTQKAMNDFLKLYKGNLVIDADGLNILSYNKDWLKLLPPATILTPHPKELQRLMGDWEDDFDKIDKMKAFSKTYDVVLVGKDARTLIVYKHEVHVNSTGNPALATGGSGDVLTGIITGLLAQSYNPIDAAVFGVYIHGLTADIAAPETGMQTFTASTILDYLGKAYVKIDTDFT